MTFDDVATTDRSAFVAPVPGPRRRWWFLAALIAACLVSAVVVPVGWWIVKGTLDASDGAETPTLAVYGVMWKMDPWSEPDLLGAGRYLSHAHFEELRQRFIDIRDTLLVKSESQFTELELSNSAEHVDGPSATVTMDVAAQFAIPGRQMLTYSTEKHPWTFQVILARGLVTGWKIDAFEAPAVCDVYVRC